MSGLMYLKEFGSYLMVGQTWTTPRSVDFLWAPTLQGPWTRVFKSNAVALSGDFLSPSPALGYTVLGTNPPHVQLTLNSNSYSGGEGAPHIAIWDLVLGRQSSGGEAFTSDNLNKYISGAGYQFSSGNIAGSFPRKGLVWSFDYLDAGVNSTLTNWPFFLERGNNSAVMVACDSDYAVAGHLRDYESRARDFDESLRHPNEQGGIRRPFPHVPMGGDRLLGTAERSGGYEGQRIVLGRRRLPLRRSYAIQLAFGYLVYGSRIGQ